MSVELKVPAVGESITTVEIGEWLVAEGAHVEKNESLVSIETDKITVELPAPAAGTVTQVLKRKGESAEVGEVIGYMEEGAAGVAAAPAEAAAPAAEAKQPEAAGQAPAHVMPAAARLLAEHGLSAEQVPASGPGGRLLKEDVQAHVGSGARPPAATPAAQPTAPAAPSRSLPAAPLSQDGDRQEEAVSMTPMRRRIAERLVEAQQTAALLTTFNEVDMTAVMALRKEYQDAFTKKHGVRLGFMSFFVKASVEALKAIPQVNAEIRGDQILYKNYYDIGVAVSGEKGLAVPVIRNAERMSFAEIEKAIEDFGKRAKESKLKLEELQGGTFTISNGGIFGSLLSTPIVNPPQSGILGMHSIQERPVARDGQVVIRPMMYLALTYDHRIVDGREAVTFLKRIKDVLESPARILLDV